MTPSRRHCLIVATFLSFAIMGCQSTRSGAKRSRPQFAPLQSEVKPRKSRRLYNRNFKRRAKHRSNNLNSYSLYDRGDLDYQILRRGKRQRLAR